MITTILSDFSRVILNPKDKNYKGTLNGFYKELKQKDSTFNFNDYFEFNDDILNLYESLKNKYSVNVFTTGTIQNDPEVRKRIDSIFDNVITAADHGLDKHIPDSYTYIANKLGKDPQQIIYIDDQLENIDAAKKSGMETLHYEEYQKLLNQLNKLLSINNTFPHN